MSNLKSVASAASYYADDNYYTQDQNAARSAWQGEGAAALGLAGEVAPEQFVAVLSGQVGDQALGRIIGRDATTGELVRDHRPGYDVTLSAPKSVSLLAEVADRSEVRAAHEAAVDKVLAYIEKNLTAMRVTEAGQTREEQTGKLVVARFHHTVSRALDPQTHTHLVIANATMGGDGVWRSLDNSSLYRSQKLLGAIYDSELAANLRALGYRIEAGPKGSWEIAGFSREQIEHFSQRARAIEDRLERFGLTRDTATAAQREDAALRTRPAKPAFSHETLRDEWLERASGIGIDFNRIEVQREMQARHPIDPAYSVDMAAASVAFALEHISERESVMSDAHLTRTALAHAAHVAPWAGVTLDRVQEAVVAALDRGQALRTAPGDITTPVAMDRERHMLSLADRGKSAVEPIARAEAVAAAIDRFELKKSIEIGQAFALTAGQEDAAVLALTSADRIVALQGYAGTGKTTMLQMVNEVARESGYEVLGVSPSAEGARTLEEESGIRSSTVAAFQLALVQEQRIANKPHPLDITGAIDLAGSDIRTIRIQLPNAPDGRSKAPAQTRNLQLWVLDEASLAGQRQVSELMEAADRTGARLILVGDRLQLNAVESGKPFELLLKHGVAQTEMTSISRQQVQDLRDAVAAAVERDNVTALGHLQSRIVDMPSKPALFEQIVADLVGLSGEARANSLLLVPLNKDREVINKMVRGELQNQGIIASSEKSFATLVRVDHTEAQRRFSAYFEPGMVLRFNRDYRQMGVQRGDYVTVRSIDSASQTAIVLTPNGRSVKWHADQQVRVESYTAQERNIGVGDEIRFTRNNKELDVQNGTPGTVTGFDGDRMVVAVGTRSVTLDPAQRSHSHWDYAYAMTVYAAQGRTTGRANFLITRDSRGAMGERSFYVGITRPRTDLRIYTDSTERTIKLIQQVQAKSSALEGMAPAAERSGAKGQGRGHGRSDGMEM
ncbi:MobF family relaxase [Pseudoduganella lurida]|nr:MobF family relaxase [Pseudoduganella lurida]